MTPYSLYVSSREGDIYTLYREITESSNRMGFHPSATYTNFHFFTPKSVLITTFNKTDEVYFSSYYPPLVICVAGPQYHCTVACYIISGEETHTSLLITVFCHYVLLHFHYYYRLRSIPPIWSSNIRCNCSSNRKVAVRRTTATDPIQTSYRHCVVVVLRFIFFFHALCICILFRMGLFYGLHSY